jgi:hypothetical protein
MQQDVRRGVISAEPRPLAPPQPVAVHAADRTTDVIRPTGLVCTLVWSDSCWLIRTSFMMGRTITHWAVRPVGSDRLQWPRCMVDNPAVPAASWTAETSPAGRRGPRVVLADDDVLLREGLASLLEGAGFDVSRVTDIAHFKRQSSGSLRAPRSLIHHW